MTINEVSSAVTTTDTPLALWAESPEEARIFLARAERQGLHQPVKEIYVAKRSLKNRSNEYVGGLYYRTSDDQHVTVYDETIEAPARITGLVQWCTCDIMLSRGDQPVLVLEDTTHIVRMNVYQRVPRLYMAAMHGVPALVLQGTRGLEFRLRGDCWGMYRYAQAFAAISRLYKDSPVLPFLYIPSESGSEAAAEHAVFAYINALVAGDRAHAAAIQGEVTTSIELIIAEGYRGHKAPEIPSIEIHTNKVIVNVGAKPEKKSWKEKGSGQMDPYIGLIAAAKYIYCYDQRGAKTKQLIVRFKFLPENFWWFKDWRTSKSLYKTLAFQIADRVEFLG